MATPGKIEPQPYAGITYAHIEAAGRKWDDLIQSPAWPNMLEDQRTSTEGLDPRDKAALYDLYDMSKAAGAPERLVYHSLAWVLKARGKTILRFFGDPPETQKDGYDVVHDAIDGFIAASPRMPALDRVASGFNRLEAGQSPEAAIRAIRDEKVNLRDPEATGAGRQQALERYHAEIARNSPRPSQKV